MDINSFVPNGAIERLKKTKKKQQKIKHSPLHELNYRVKANGTFQTNDCVFFVMCLRMLKKRKKNIHKVRGCLFVCFFCCCCFCTSLCSEWMAALSSSGGSAVQMRYGLAEVCRCLLVCVGASSFLNPAGTDRNPKSL